MMAGCEDCRFIQMIEGILPVCVNADAPLDITAGCQGVGCEYKNIELTDGLDGQLPALLRVQAC